MSLLSKSALAALLVTVSLGAANAQQASRQIQVLPAEQPAAAQVAQAPAQAPVAEQAPADTNAQAPAVKAEPEKPAFAHKKVVRFEHPPVHAPRYGYAAHYAPRYSGHCNNSYRGYRGY